MERGAVRQSPRADVRFRRLYDENFLPVRSYCLRRIPVSEVNDAVADVFLVTWRRIDEAPSGDEARLWLYGIARNVVRNADRSRRRRARLQGRLESLAPNTGPTPESIVVRRAEEEEVLQALEGLRPMDREVLQLSIWEQLGNNEIATVLGIEPHTVTMRLGRARKRMAKRLRIETGAVRRVRSTPIGERSRG